MIQRVSHARAPAASSELLRSSRSGFFGQLSSDGAALRGTSHTRQQQTRAAVHASSSVTPVAMPAMPPSASVCPLPPTGAEAAQAAQRLEAVKQWSVKHEDYPPDKIRQLQGVSGLWLRAHAISSAEVSEVQMSTSESQHILAA